MPIRRACSRAGCPAISPTPFTPPAKTVPASVQREKQSTHPYIAFFAPSKVERPFSAAVANRYASVNA